MTYTHIHNSLLLRYWKYTTDMTVIDADLLLPCTGRLYGEGKPLHCKILTA
jgi:hypothetical protein